MDTAHALARYYAAAPAPAMDEAAAPAAASAEDSFSALRAAIARDDWVEQQHPRQSKGGSKGGQFAMKPETILKIDAGDRLSKAEGRGAISSAVERSLEDAVRKAGPVGTTAYASVFKEFGKPTAAIRLVNNARERFSAADVRKMMEALAAAGCEGVEEVRDDDRPAHETSIFCTPPVDPETAAMEYMKAVEGASGASASSGGSGFRPSEDAKASAKEMAKNVDTANPSKRIRVDFQEWTLESAQREEPVAKGTEEAETDGKAFPDAKAAAKWLLDAKNAGPLEGDPAWYSSVAGEGGRWRTYCLTPVNFTENEILDIEEQVVKAKGDEA